MGWFVGVCGAVVGHGESNRISFRLGTDVEIDLDKFDELLLSVEPDEETPPLP